MASALISLCLTFPMRRAFHFSRAFRSERLFSPLREGSQHRSLFFGARLGGSHLRKVSRIAWTTTEFRNHRLGGAVSFLLLVRYKWTVDLSNQNLDETDASNIVEHSSNDNPKEEGSKTSAEPNQPKNAVDFLTYQGWDTLETDPHTVRDVAEWDPVTKKIVKKMLVIPITEEQKQHASRRALNEKRKAYEKMAKRNPLHKKCRTCPICTKSFQGHNQMVAHLIGREQCVSALDVTVREQLLEQKRNKRTKSERRKLRRRGIHFATLEKDAERSRKLLEKSKFASDTIRETVDHSSIDESNSDSDKKPPDETMEGKSSPVLQNSISETSNSDSDDSKDFLEMSDSDYSDSDEEDDEKEPETSGVVIKNGVWQI